MNQEETNGACPRGGVSVEGVEKKGLAAGRRRWEWSERGAAAAVGKGESRTEYGRSEMEVG